VGIEAKTNNTKCIRVMRNLTNFREYMNVDSHAFEGVRMVKYLGVLVTKMKIRAGN
jgi:hypothetical protein